MYRPEEHDHLRRYSPELTLKRKLRFEIYAVICAQMKRVDFASVFYADSPKLGPNREVSVQVQITP